MPDDRLEGRHVIVTGGAMGMGRGIATRCSRAGADITIFDVEPETAQQTVAQIESEGQAATVVELDVADIGAHEQAIETAVTEFGPIDGLVNNAGVQDVLPILETTPEDWDYHLNVNAKAPFFLSKHVARHMIDAGVSGGIVTIASSAEDVTYPGQGAYRASKRAVRGFTTVLAKEVGEHGIRVNSVNPGAVDTPMMQKWLEENEEQTEHSREEIREMVLEDHIIKRMATGEEIGNVVVLLLSDEGEWITGGSFAVDGGQSVLP